MFTLTIENNSEWAWADDALSKCEVFFKIAFYEIKFRSGGRKIGFIPCSQYI